MSRPPRRGGPKGSGKGGPKRGPGKGGSPSARRSPGRGPAAAPSGRGPSSRAGDGPRRDGARRSGPGSSAPRRGLGGDQVEGRQAVRELLLAGQRPVREVFVAADIDPAPIVDDILELAADERVVVQRPSRSRLEAMARTDAPQGVVALAAPLAEVDLDDLASGAVRATAADEGAPFLLALDGITDPGNLGAMLRSASAAGVTGVVLPRHRAAHVSPAVTKAAAGAIEHMPIALVGGLPTALSRLRALDVWSVGLDAEGDRSLWDLPPVDDAVVVVVGAEGAGLSRLVGERCDVVASIPMAGPLGSLNAATAAALACFEVARRRA